MGNTQQTAHDLEDEDEVVDEGHFSDISSEDEPDVDDEPVYQEVLRDTAHVRDMAAKLDAILKLLFDHLITRHSSDPPVLPPMSSVSSPSSSSPTSPIPTETSVRIFELQRAQFHTLLHTFERTVLRTFKSRYTQFVIFWFSSLHPDFADEFLGTLIHKVITLSEPTTTRAAAASYLASFVSRARFVDGDTVRRVVRLLCTYLTRELELYAEQKEAIHISHFTPFYAVSQAVFLIFCFRWRDLQEEQTQEVQADDEEANDELGLNAAAAKPERANWMTELDVLQQIIVSPLNPLKVTSPYYIQCPRDRALILHHLLSSATMSSLSSSPLLRLRQISSSVTRFWSEIGAAHSQA